MSAQVAADLRAGDVIRYEPKSTWYYDGYAIAEERRVGGLILVDTYWYAGTSGDVVFPETYELLFNLGDYDAKPAHEWETFAPADRQYIPKHSGYRTVHYVRKGATPDLATQIENAQERVTEAEADVRSAEWRLKYTREVLAELEAKTAVA